MLPCAHMLYCRHGRRAAVLYCLTAGNVFVHVWGTSPDPIDIAEDRDRWMEMLMRFEVRQPAGGTCRRRNSPWCAGGICHGACLSWPLSVSCVRACVLVVVAVLQLGDEAEPHQKTQGGNTQLRI